MGGVRFFTFGGHMQKYQILTTISEQPSATRASDLLEGAGIPIVVEHVDLGGGEYPIRGFRVLVPAEFSRSAQRLIAAAANLHHKLN